MTVMVNRYFKNVTVDVDGSTVAECTFEDCVLEGKAKAFVDSRFINCKDASLHTKHAVFCIFEKCGPLYVFPEVSLETD